MGWEGAARFVASGSALGRCHVTPAPSVERALDEALARHGASAHVAVIPKGPYVIPCLENADA